MPQLGCLVGRPARPVHLVSFARKRTSNGIAHVTAGTKHANLYTSAREHTTLKQALAMARQTAAKRWEGPPWLLYRAVASAYLHHEEIQARCVATVKCLVWRRREARCTGVDCACEVSVRARASRSSALASDLLGALAARALYRINTRLRTPQAQTKAWQLRRPHSRLQRVGQMARLHV